MTIAKLKQRLRNKAIDDAIISAVLDVPRIQFSDCDEISDTDAALCVEVKRIGRELAYKRGKWRFYDLPLIITPDVIPPCPDSEILVQTTITKLKDICDPKILDVGTGSGALGIAIAKNVNCDLFMSDISKDALAIATKNASLNAVKVKSVTSDMFKQIENKFDIIVSSLPQITTQRVNELAQQGRLYMPRIAIDGGEDGLEYIRIFATEASNYLNDGGLLLLVIGYDPTSVIQIFTDSSWKNIETVKDINGFPRVLIAQKP